MRIAARLGKNADCSEAMQDADCSEARQDADCSEARQDADCRIGYARFGLQRG